MTTCDVLKLRLVTPQDAKAVKNYLREIFFEYEPIHQHLFSKECKNFRYFDRVGGADECIGEGLSYMYTTEDGEIAALALVGYLVSSASTKNATPIHRKLIPFFDMIGEEAKKITNLTEADKEVTFRILSVHPDWMGNGLAKLLMEKVLASVKSLGFTHIRSFCTSAYSTKLFEKYGFKAVYSIKYADYTQNGEVILLPNNPHTHLNLMHIKL